MPSEMAEHATDEFHDWLVKTEDLTDGEAFSSIAIAFQEWLREAGGLQRVAESYSLAVETALLVLSIDELRAHLPAASSVDQHAWDFMTEAGFAYECYHYGGRSNQVFE